MSNNFIKLKIKSLNFKNNKKAIGPIIAISLLIVVSVGALVFFQDWFNNYSSNLIADVELETSNNLNSEIKIETIIGDMLYLVNNYKDNLNLSKITIDGFNCSLTNELSLGLVSINISDCLNQTSSQSPNILIMTDNNIIEKKIFIKTYDKLEIVETFEPGVFVSVWDTRLNSSTGSSDIYSITLPLTDSSSSSYNFVVDWGDGTNSSVTSWNHINKTHTYSTPGIYTLKITGDFTGFRFNNLGDRLKLLEIKNWGNLRLGNNYGGYFYGAQNLQITAKDILNTTGTTRMNSMFRSARSLTTIPTINDWNMSQVITISHMFAGATDFNQDLDGWNTSKVNSVNSIFSGAINFNGNISTWDLRNVQSFDYMFWNAHNFNQPINTWNTSNVTSMLNMFNTARSFNQDLDNWDVSNVVDLSGMFQGADNFNGSVHSWDTSNVESMSGVFYSANSFNRNVSSWNTSKVTTMSSMFRANYYFNQDLSSWDVSKVTNMGSMFYYAYRFDSNISSWDVSKVTNMGNMFHSTSISSDLSSWNVSKVTTMRGMFTGANRFNSNISIWDTSSALDMGWMFGYARNFNQDLSSWDVSNVTNMEYMFGWTDNFNSNISSWDVSKVTNMDYMFYGSDNFNQDLSCWNVTNIVDPPDNFNSNTPSWSLPKPVWGSSGC